MYVIKLFQFNTSVLEESKGNTWSYQAEHSTQTNKKIKTISYSIAKITYFS